MEADIIRIKKGEVLMHEGEESTQMYYVNDGTLAVFKRKGGTIQQIGTIYSGEVVGEMSFLDKEPRSATVEALSECELTVIPSDKFEKTFHALPSWYRALVRTLLERLRRANSRIRI